MAVPSIAGSLTNQSLGTQSAAVSSDPGTEVSKRPDAKTEKQPGSTEVRLSAHGQAKAAFAQIQSAGQTAADTRKTASEGDVKKAAAGFVEAFNRASKTAAGTELSRALAQGGTLGDLKQVGIAQNTDGSLSVDSKIFGKALQTNPEQVRGALANAGQQVARTAARELENGDNAGASTSAPSSRTREVESQRSAQQEQAAAAQRLAEQRKAQTNNNVVAGSLAAYQRTFIG